MNKKYETPELIVRKYALLASDVVTTSDTEEIEPTTNDLLTPDEY